MFVGSDKLNKIREKNPYGISPGLYDRYRSLL